MKPVYRNEAYQNEGNVVSIICKLRTVWAFQPEDFIQLLLFSRAKTKCSMLNSDILNNLSVLEGSVSLAGVDYF